MVSRIPPPEDDGTNRQPRSAGLLAVVVVFALAVGIWLLNGRDPGSAASTASDDTSAAAPAGPGDPTDPPATSDPAEPGSSPSPAPEAPSGTVTLEKDEASSAPPSIGPDSGLPTVYLLDLPPEAAETVEAIESGPPYDYKQDGSTFATYEGLLPDHERGYYEEFTVETPGSYDRGARRIIEGGDGQLFWTDDHYESFSRVLL